MFQKIQVDGKGANYQVKECGANTLVKSGEQTITIIPIHEGWKTIAIKKVVFTPVKQFIKSTIST